MASSIKLSERAIEEFISIYENEFGQKLTENEALEIALRVLRLFALVTEPNLKAPRALP
jgi:hypothetical protein